MALLGPFPKFFCIPVTNNHDSSALSLFTFWIVAAHLALTLYLVFHFQSALQSVPSWAPLPVKFISWWQKEQILGIWLCPLLPPWSREKISAMDGGRGQGSGNSCPVFESAFVLCTSWFHAGNCSLQMLPPTGEGCNPHWKKWEAHPPRRMSWICTGTLVPDRIVEIIFSWCNISY